MYLAGDVKFVDGLAYIVTALKDVKFITEHQLPSRTAPELAASLKEKSTNKGFESTDTTHGQGEGETSHSQSNRTHHSQQGAWGRYKKAHTDHKHKGERLRSSKHYTIQWNAEPNDGGAK